MEFLNKIIQRQKEVLEQRRSQLPEIQAAIADLPATKGFAEALRNAPTTAIIAEMKQKSPSAGMLREDYDPLAIAQAYQQAGANCLSVLTNEFFAGADEHIQQLSHQVSLPLLRKDFIIDEYQVYETRALGADALLLIAACLDDAELEKLANLGLELGLDLLLEVHNQPEAERAVGVVGRLGDSERVEKSVLLGVNNRDLHSFKVDLSGGAKVLSYLRDTCDCLLVGESGIKGREDIDSLQAAGAQAFLIGESFMRAPDPGAALKEFISP